MTMLLPGEKVQQMMALPTAPTLCSDTAGWEHVQLALFEQPAHCIPEHVSLQHVICINAGVPVRLAQTIDGKTLVGDSVAGDVGIYPAQLWQTFEWESDAKFLQLYLDPVRLNQVGWELYGKDEVELLPQALPAEPMISQIAIALKTTLQTTQQTTPQTQPTGSRLYADTLANALYAHLVYHYVSDQVKARSLTGHLSPQQLKQVTHYIETHLAEDISLATLASVVQLSPFHFSRLFKASTGSAPHQYHIRCRVNRVKQLLKVGELPLAQIAQAVGFSSQSHLNYHFKRVVGLSPTAYNRL